MLYLTFALVFHFLSELEKNLKLNQTMNKFHKIPVFFIYTEHKDSITIFFRARFLIFLLNLALYWLSPILDQAERLRTTSWEHFPTQVRNFLFFNLGEKIL